MIWFIYVVISYQSSDVLIYLLNYVFSVLFIIIMIRLASFSHQCYLVDFH